MNKDLKKILNSAIVPAIWIVFMWVIHIGIWLLDIHHEAVTNFGLHTQKTSGLIGILTAPFLHGDWNHLISNTTPFFILGTGIIYFYRKSAFLVFLLSWILPNAFVWALVNPSYHIGASGMVYAFAFFLFFSGVFRRERRALVLSLLVSFGYGSIVWGVLPIQEGVSWQSHLFGALMGILMAWLFRGQGDLKKKAEEEEPDLYEPGIPIWDYKSLYPPPEGMNYPEDEK
ncbi:MAG: rhomboid family intramembrane serine protease [Bacteroidia bacterium]|nr:rhomboid family intramembrane serine protease [Bacteroidia bacterium]